MENKRTSIITVDKDFSGLGYARLRDGTQIVHTICLFIFTIMWIRPIKIGKKQIAKWISSKNVQIDDKIYSFEYFGYTDNLKVIYHRNSLGVWCITSEFQELNNGSYALKDEVSGQWKVYDSVDISLFNPNAKIEGYVKGNKFIGIKELSIG